MFSFRITETLLLNVHTIYNKLLMNLIFVTYHDMALEFRVWSA